MPANILTVSPSLVSYARVRHPRYGLGVIEILDDNRVTVEFDSGQTHTFSRDDTELTRMVWRVGAHVEVRGKGMVGIIRSVASDDTFYRYRVELSITGEQVTVTEGGISDLNDSVGAVSDPVEGLRLQQFDHPRLFYARTMAHYLASSRQQLVRSGATARIDSRPHQIFVARRVVTAPRPRFLLADEVGLGKTIEAGLVIQELRARGSLERVLIVVPANLTHQWRNELEQKFNERFTIFDTNTIREIRSDHPGESPWLVERNIICSHGYIEQHEEIWPDIVRIPWDMLIVDEAHHARRKQMAGNRREATRLYRFISQLSERTRSLLLLTATPMQLQTFELFSLIELLDCGLFYNYDYFEQQRRYNTIINALIKDLHECDQLDQNARASLEAGLRMHLPKDHHALIDRAATSPLARQQLVERLSEKHLLSEVMIRNRKRIIGEFTKRKPHIIPVEFSDGERLLYDAVSTYVRSAYRQIDQRRRGVVGFLLVAYQRRLTSSTFAFCKTVERRLAKLDALRVNNGTTPRWSEDDDLDEILGAMDQVAFGEDAESLKIERRLLQDLLVKARAVHGDTKCIAFLQFLGQLFLRNPDEQVLVFTQFYDTLEYLRVELTRRWRGKIEVFHGGMRPKDKDDAIERFRQGQARILISTEAGGEGRNLQFCAVLVNYDLPWNPMKVEQRIGRIDRIGQHRDVLICNFALRGTVEDRVLELLNHRIHIFEETVGGLDPILGELEMDLQKIVLETAPDQIDQVLTQRGKKLELDIENARRAEEAQRDFIVDLRSFNRQAKVIFDPAEQQILLDASQHWSQVMLKQVGAAIEQRADGALIVQLGKRRGGILPGLRDRIFDITFDYQQALDRPGLEYGSFGHPLFDALIEYGTNKTFSRGAVAQRTVANDQYVGFRGFQFNFVITEQSVHKTNSIITIAVDESGIYQPDIGDLLLGSIDVDLPSISTSRTSRVDWVEQVDHAHDVAEQELQRILQERAAVRKQEVEPAIRKEEQQIKRYCDVRLRAAEEKLRHDWDILNRLQRSSAEDDRRVVPIWRRNVENVEAYIKSLQQEQDRQLRELDQRRRVTYSYDLLNTAHVCIVASATLGVPSLPKKPKMQTAAVALQKSVVTNPPISSSALNDMAEPSFQRRSFALTSEDTFTDETQRAEAVLTPVSEDSTVLASTPAKGQAQPTGEDSSNTEAETTSTGILDGVVRFFAGLFGKR